MSFKWQLVSFEIMSAMAFSGVFFLTQTVLYQNSQILYPNNHFLVAHAKTTCLSLNWPFSYNVFYGFVLTVINPFLLLRCQSIILWLQVYHFEFYVMQIFTNILLSTIAWILSFRFWQIVQKVKSKSKNLINWNTICRDYVQLSHLVFLLDEKLSHAVLLMFVVNYIYILHCLTLFVR